nr:hypothetical protein B0A51_14678 [Rachicladosporium sp. CCFEE 5018]
MATSSFPAFLDSDPFPTNPDRRPISSGSATTDGTSEYGGDDDYTSAKERQSNIASSLGPNGPAGEPGLPPSRPSSIGAASGKRASVRSSLLPPPSRRGLAAFVTSPKGATRDGARGGERPMSPNHSTHVPIIASGFANPMSGKDLQAQRGQRGFVTGGATVQPREQKRQTPEERERETRHRYSNASVNTLRDGLPPTTAEDAPPLPTSRGTDGTFDHNQTFSMASGNSTAPLTTLRSGEAHRSEFSPTVPSKDLPRRSPTNQSLRASLRLKSRSASWQRPSETHQQLHSDPSSPANGTSEKAAAQLPYSKTQSRKPTRGKNYEYYAGAANFFLSGRLMNAHAKPISIATFLLILIPAILFLALSAPYLWTNVSPALPIIFAYILLLTISSFLHASFSDPGILPRNLHPHPPASAAEIADPLAPGPATTEWVLVRSFPPQPANPNPEAGAGAAHAMEVPVKFCKSCTLWRPPRAHHCRICDACVETQDHHCVWLNNCVGRRNHRYFFSFISSASLLAAFLLAFTATHLASYPGGFGGAIGRASRVQERTALALMIYGILAFPYPASLWGYHVFLMSRGETTREYLNSHKFPAKDRHRPFTMGSSIQARAKNVLAVLLRPRPPQCLGFKRKWEEGDARFGHVVPKRERKKDAKERWSVELEKLPGSGKGEGSGASGSGHQGSPRAG